jgi:hypothetical protein
VTVCGVLNVARRESQMAKTVQVFRSPEDADLWRVALDGKDLVGFYGPKAQLLAERHRDELAELLGAVDAGNAARTGRGNEMAAERLRGGGMASHESSRPAVE